MTRMSKLGGTDRTIVVIALYGRGHKEVYYSR